MKERESKLGMGNPRNGEKRSLEAKRIFHFANFAVTLGKLETSVGLFLLLLRGTTQLKRLFRSFSIVASSKVLIDFFPSLSSP
jgi:hypothetical protein